MKPEPMAGQHIGLSSHTPELANEVLDMGILDMLMFSVNPAYDYAGGSEPKYAADCGRTDEFIPAL